MGKGKGEVSRPCLSLSVPVCPCLSLFLVSSRALDVIDVEAGAVARAEGFDFDILKHPALVDLLDGANPHLAYFASLFIDLCRLHNKFLLAINPESDLGAIFHWRRRFDFEDIAKSTFNFTRARQNRIVPPDEVQGNVELRDVGSPNGGVDGGGVNWLPI